MHDPVLHLLGLAKKAGRVELGEEPVGAACRARQAKLLLLAGDAAANTCRRAAHFAQAGNIPFLSLPQDKSALGFAFGRNSLAMLAITDIGLACAVAQRLAAIDSVLYGPVAEQLDKQAQRAAQRRKEQRRHDEKLRTGKKPPPRTAAQPDRPDKADTQHPRKDARKDARRDAPKAGAKSAPKSEPKSAPKAAFKAAPKPQRKPYHTEKTAPAGRARPADSKSRRDTARPSGRARLHIKQSPSGPSAGANAEKRGGVHD